MQRKWTVDEIRREAADFDWSKVDALTDAEITAAAKADPDSTLPTDGELAESDLVIPAKRRRLPPKEAAE